jgi:hypothetical protein
MILCIGLYGAALVPESIQMMSLEKKVDGQSLLSQIITCLTHLRRLPVAHACTYRLQKSKRECPGRLDSSSKRECQWGN